ncbi:hypothetical protein J7354_01655 [Sulfitobacter sp. R18_2]|uniref:hypothetical protein n=1 Tax=Sulfitobacter sp. R18_2 TaxID=2821105 RepID=UPI001ADB11B1|nr:hypothetical protein [Sulfitobacter sp. R18_2]MBO9437356.1 hypothetical protein [Sulfitobacter sp. R18_2]
MSEKLAKAESAERWRVKNLRASCSHRVAQVDPVKQKWFCVKCGQKVNHDHEPI